MKTIAEGTQAPTSTCPTRTAAPSGSASAGNGPVVLFFYPVALTGGCTAEACHFRDLGTEFKEAGGQRSASARTRSEPEGVLGR